jgi:hypothetical protein
MSGDKPGGLNQFPFRAGTYLVTKVYCTQYECLGIAKCHDGKGNCDEGVCAEIGLQETDEGCYMICHDYTCAGSQVPSDKKVYWRRKVPK